MSSFSLTPVFSTLFSTWGSGLINLKTGFLVLFALQLGLRYEFAFPENYLNRLLPLFSPYLFIIVPDNACQRSFYIPNSPKLSFDFIVVGAGAAGSVIAERLSRNTDRRVLVVEAGGDPSSESVVPQFFPFVMNNTNTWRYNAEIVSTSANAYKNGCPLPFGKQLGGSTETNAMLYVCANDRDYDSWAAAGNTGWDYNSMLPLIKRTEGNSDSSISGNGYHGTSGPLKVSTPYREPLVDNIEAAFSSLQYKILQDYNARQYNGFVRCQATISGGERFSAYRAFLVPAKNRTNLFFMKNTLATSIIFSGTKAIGINVKTSEVFCPNIKLIATKEVIISAGGHGSPKILLQSGIGKPADLPAGITFKKDLPVGYNYQDHVMSVHFIRVNPGTRNQTALDTTFDFMQYYYSRTGPGAALGIWNGQGFINTQDVNATYPDIQFDFYKFAKDQEYMTVILANFGLKDEYVAKVVQDNALYEIIMVYNILLNPKARGVYKLRNSDPYSKPNITSNFLTNADDVDTMVRGIRKMEALINTSAIQALTPSLVRFDIAECDSLTYQSEDYWKCYIKYVTQTLWHPTGTCKMGPATNSTSVVDPTLKVIGLTNLRVADASIMPTITSGNTQCPTYSIGQKAADLISADWP